MGLQRQPGAAVPSAAVLAWPAQEAGRGFCCQSGVGKVSQDLASSDRPVGARSLGLTQAGKQSQPKARAVTRFRWCVVCTQVAL